MLRIPKELDEETLELGKQYEGLGPNVRNGRAYEYVCPAGKPTIAHGHVISAAERKNGLLVAGQRVPVSSGLKIPQQTDALYRYDKQRFCDQAHAILSAIPGLILTSHEFGAIVLLIYNNGPDPLYKTLGNKLRAGDKFGAVLEFAKWCNATVYNSKYPKGRFGPVTGLTWRRYSEMLLFLTGQSKRIYSWGEFDVVVKKIQQHFAQAGQPVPALPLPVNTKERQIA